MKKNLLTVLILALLIVNIVLTSIMMVSVTSTNKKTGQLVTDIASVMKLELTVPGQENADTAKDVSIADTEVHNLAQMTIPLAIGADGKQAYMLCTVGLLMDTKDKAYKKSGSKVSDGSMDTILQDAINSVISSHTREEIQSDMEGIKAEILVAIQSLLQADYVYKVSISDYQFG